MLGLPILYLKGMRLMMFQLSGFCCSICKGFATISFKMFQSLFLSDASRFRWERAVPSLAHQFSS